MIKIQTKCRKCCEILESCLSENSEGITMYIQPCPRCPQSRHLGECIGQVEESKPKKMFWQDLVSLLEGTTVELKYYRKDGIFREFDCLLHDGGENGKVYIFDQDAKTIKSLIKKNICGVFDYHNDKEYQVIGGLY
jgi:hypothetical protein